MEITKADMYGVGLFLIKDSVLGNCMNIFSIRAPGIEQLGQCEDWAEIVASGKEVVKTFVGTREESIAFVHSHHSHRLPESEVLRDWNNIIADELFKLLYPEDTSNATKPGGISEDDEKKQQMLDRTLDKLRLREPLGMKIISAVLSQSFTHYWINIEDSREPHHIVTKLLLCQYEDPLLMSHVSEIFDGGEFHASIGGDIGRDDGRGFVDHIWVTAMSRRGE